MPAAEAVSVQCVGYGLFPFVVVVQLAIFPLSWSCTLRLALPIALLLATPMLSGELGNGPAPWNLLWLLALLLALAAWPAAPSFR